MDDNHWQNRMPFIENQLRRALDQKIETGVDWCVTLESIRNPEHWIQLTWEHVNMYYPYDTEPASALASIGWPNESLELESWESNTFVTFSHFADESIADAVAFVQRYIETILKGGCNVEDWRVSEEDI